MKTTTDEIVIEYSITRKEYLTSFLLGSYKSKTLIVSTCVGFILLALSFYHLPDLKLGEYFPVSLTISFGLATTVFTPLVLLWLGNKKYSIHPELNELIQLKIDSDIISVIGQTFHYQVATNTINKLQLNLNVYYLTSPKKAVLIPKRCLTENDEIKIKRLFKPQL